MSDIANAESKNNYNIPFIQLDKLADIKYGKYHYNYKTVDFMFNFKKNAKKTLIAFHGRVHSHESWPVFYKHNFEHNNFNVLSISDRLLEQTRELHNTMYLSVKKLNYHEIYFEIISIVLNLTKTEKNIFFGSCSGSFPAVRYGSLFNGYILCMNGYVFLLKNYFDSYNKKISKFINDEFIYIDNFNVILKSPPKHIYLYINKNDTITFDLNKNFIVFCKKNLPDRITHKLHDTVIEGKDPHDVHFPEGDDFISAIERI